jgi:hypothetical protein
VTSKTRVGLLTVLAVGWFFLAVANIIGGRVAIGALYAVCGVVVSALTLRLSRGRRTR